MIRNLAGTGSHAAHADVAVIGAGTVGLVVSALLARRGLSVICLESGDRQQEAEEHPLNEVEQARAHYSGAAHGRFRCLGGTSTRWGGALIPFQAADLEGDAWPLSNSTLATYVKPVESFFGLDHGPYEPEEWNGLQLPGFVARLAKWPPFKKRNVFTLLGSEVSSEGGPQVWLNATVCEFVVDASSLQRIVARAPDGSVLDVTAHTFVIAAGAIETTRLTLLMDRQNAGVVSACSPALGQYFHDHLSVPVADLVIKDRKRLNRLLSFRFGAGGSMQNLRFELAEAAPNRRKLPACFAHLTFEGGGGGYEALREVFRRLQRGSLPSTRMLLQLCSGAPWILRSVWWRYVEKRLLLPGDCRLMFNMVIEQQPVPGNCISLSASRVDCYGQALARIDWEVGEADRHNIGEAARAFVSHWEESPLRELATLKLLSQEDIEAGLVTGGGIYHPGGSTRMAAQAHEGVVDTDLRLFALPNVRLLSTSVLPTGGGANPTMMLMLLGFRLVDQLAAPVER